MDGEMASFIKWTCECRLLDGNRPRLGCLLARGVGDDIGADLESHLSLGRVPVVILPVDGEILRAVDDRRAVADRQAFELDGRGLEPEMVFPNGVAGGERLEFAVGPKPFHQGSEANIKGGLIAG